MSRRRPFTARWLAPAAALALAALAALAPRAAAQVVVPGVAPGAAPPARDTADRRVPGRVRDRALSPALERRRELSPAALETPAPAPPPPILPPRQDSILPRSLFADTVRLRLGFEALGPVFPQNLPAAPGAHALWLRPREDWTASWAAAARRHAAARIGGLAFAAPPRPAPAEGPAAKSAPEAQWVEGFLPPPPQRDTARKPNLLPGAVANYADIGMRVSGRGELGSSWTRYYPCDPTLMGLCNPSLFPQLKPDLQFGVQVGGTVSDRVHVNVDYDQRREFDAANNINIYYQGFEDEVLQRLEVGDVSIKLPQSRYLTQGIPAGNFGFKATGQLGPMDFQTVWAQQKGDVSKREFRLNGGGGQSAGLVQDASVTLDDADYVKGQFFFVLDPDSLRGAPDINPLQLQSQDAPGGSRPAPGTLVIYRDERISPSSQAQVGQLGYFMANAVAHGAAGDSVVHTGFFRRLQPGQDYTVHSSGLWIVLRAPLRQDEALAMGYITEQGDTVGSVDADAQRSTTPTLRLLRGPLSMHQPGSPTWPLEMHDVYRVDASSGVDVSTVDLKISLGQLSGGKTFTTVAGKQITYLKLMGLDELPPADALDGVQIYQPSPSDPNGGSMSAGTPSVGGTYLVFPTLRPFEAPPPVPSAGLTTDQSAAALGSDANRDIYENPDPIARDAAGRFRLNFTYRVAVGGMVSTLNLGALGIREGSEKIYVGDQQLQNGKDYTIDYDIGTVTLLNPQAIFGANPDAQIRATWEQKAMFQLAPTSIFGVNTRYQLGQRGELNLIGLYQSEKTLMNRPELGTEPSSIFLGGASGKLDLGGAALDALFSHLPGLHYSGKSAVSVTGEAALSAPNPNTRGAAYLDDFEAGDETTVGLNRQAWHLGSRPAYDDGAADVLPAMATDEAAVASAMKLVWQHDYLLNGQVGGALDPQQIDRSFTVANGGVGGSTGEPVMWLTMGGDTLPPELGHDAVQPRWRSITTVLSTTGRDMSRSEYLEFYVQPPRNADGQPDNSAAVIVDVGTVSEDAFQYDAQGQTTGIYPDGRPWGLGVLDQEADLASHEIWGPASDSLGLWNQPCHAGRGLTYALGDARSNCTRGNGLMDTEDLNGDGILGSDGAYFRYVVKLGPSSPYLVRDENGTGTKFRLYRIPLRGPGAIAVNSASDATWRYIQDLRLTVVDSVGGDLVKRMGIARMRIIGSRWAKRDLAGVEQGLTGTTPLAGDTAAFQVGPVSGLTDNQYASPPGIAAAVQDPTSQFALGAAQIINEKSLRLAVDQLAPKTRVEAYYRYPQQPRSFLSYREMRVWAVARKGSWGNTGDQRLLIKVGSDPSNYYFYQARLKQPQAAFDSTQWLPEIVIDFQPWFTLRAQAEAIMVAAAAAPPDTAPFVLWSPDSSYGIVLQDRARAPNLAAVRELSVAIYNGGLGTEPSEVWIDDLRLSAAMTDPGFAGNVQVDIHAGNFLSASASMASQGALFHQLNQNASYQRTADASLNGSVQLGMMAPPSWDLDAPLTVSWGKSAQAPQFLSGTDLPADQLQNLRRSGSNQLRVGFTLRRRSPAANPLLGLVVDGLSLRLGYSGASTETATSLSLASGVNGALSYDRRPSARDFGIVPGFAKNALKALFPGRLERSDFFQHLTGARLRWSPEAISFSSSYYNQKSDVYLYDQVLRLPTDTLPPTSSARLGLDNSARLAMHPLESLTASLSLGSTRDLLPAARASDQLHVQQAIDAARGGLAGLTLGWESSRNVSTQLDWHPAIAAWLRPGFTFNGQFRANRNPSFLQLMPLGGDSLAADSTAIMQQQFQANRQITRSLQLDPNGLLGALLNGKKAPGPLAVIVKAFQPLDLAWTSGQSSQFDRMDGSAGTSYQLGLGSLGAWRYFGPDTATVANTSGGFRGRGTIVLPFGTQITTSYNGQTTQLFDLRGGQRTDENRTWPALQLTWSRIPIPRGVRVLLTQMSASGGYQHTLHTSSYGALGFTGGAGVGLAGGGDVVGGGGTLGGGLVGRGTGEETSIPVQLSLGLAGTLSASYNGSFTSGTQSDPTGDARKDASNHSLSISGFFKAPHSLRDRLRNPIEATVGLSRQADRECRMQSGTDGTQTCTPFTDYTMRQINVSLDTELNQVTVGLQMSYNARNNNIGTLNGSSQFQLGIFGQFNISAGHIPGAER